MKKLLFPGIIILLAAIFPPLQILAQTATEDFAKVEKCIQKYQDLSALGSPGSIYTDSATIVAFRELFDINANMYWDLYTGKNPTSNIQPFIDEYLDSIFANYKDLKPHVSYGKYTIKINPDGKTALATLVKTNFITETTLGSGSKPFKNMMTLRVLLNIYENEALILNISRDTRLTRIRSFYVEGGYNLVNTITGPFFATPVSNIDPEVVEKSTLENGGGYCLGASADIRMNTEKADGFLINIGLRYSTSKVTLNMNDYVYNHREVYNSFSCSPGNEFAFETTVTDQASMVREKLTFSVFSLPITAKWYFSGKGSGKMSAAKKPGQGKSKARKSVRLKWYGKAGLQFNYLSGTTQADYTLNHWGKGKFYYLSEASLPEAERRWFYLSDNEAMANGFDFFSEKALSNSNSLEVNQFYLSGILASGVEVKINKVLIGIEPFINIGLSSVSSSQGKTNYPLYPSDSFNSFLLTYNGPMLTTAGLNIIFGNLFTRKY